MKKIATLTIIFCTFGCVYGQNEKKHYIGVHYPYGACRYHYSSIKNNSWKEFDGKNYCGFGFDYKYRSSEISELCLGVAVTINKVDMTSTNIGWGNGRTYTSDDSYIITSLPVHLRFHFLKYLFAGGDPCLNYHSKNVGTRWGLGIGITAGAEYVFKSGLAISFTPRAQWNGLDIFKNRDPFVNNGNIGILTDKMFQMGFNIELGYKFGKQ